MSVSNIPEKSSIEQKRMLDLTLAGFGRQKSLRDTGKLPDLARIVIKLARIVGVYEKKRESLCRDTNDRTSF